MAIKKRPANPINYPLPKHLVNGIAHKVLDGQNWWSVATQYNIDVWKLIEFNFQTRDPDEVNWYLNEKVGCTLETIDRKNYRFSTSAGFIYIPKRTVSFDGDVVDADGVTLLESRWDDRKDDIKKGRELLANLLKAAHAEARTAASLPEGKLMALCDDVKDFIGDPQDKPGAPAPWTMLVTCLAGSFEYIGQASQAKHVSAVRWPLFQAFARGVANALDPAYGHARPKGELAAKFYDAGRRAIQRLTPTQKYQLRLALVEDYRNYGLTAAPHFSDTAEAFEDNWSGSTFALSVLNELAKTKYSVD